ncbi:phosphoadenylyl-sulfate reductase [Cyanobium sp. Morenito 9A2]|uniref:phosphoadenylyl-sulfate reductase n=1 Tax=Cyanobium sp. Morenito 9A2 TaxID=2823718 RepID=UPI0020CF0438|nr:phosphoadenylyl-sulfate reductase [Cyanobium sp. Morenito 9A2]MCP9849859.1 phosphoadenylyl-sulfate reductase [Cyanobium sp. Morenito 9A2]
MTLLAELKLPTDGLGQPIDLIAARTDLETADAAARLQWGFETFGDAFALTTSFGIQSAVLLHMVSRLSDRIPVLWVDTGYLPEATYRYADTLCRLLPLNLQVLQSPMSPARMEALHGRLWETGNVDDLTLYHQLRKVEPLDRALNELGVRCWASGVRGGQTDHRKTMAILDPVREHWSLRPLLEWTSRDVFYYMNEHGLPQHPLFEAGYSTVGDWHSSAPDDGSGAGHGAGRATRFGGLKQECGIHLPGEMGDGI